MALIGNSRAWFLCMVMVAGICYLAIFMEANRHRRSAK